MVTKKNTKKAPFFMQDPNKRQPIFNISSGERKPQKTLSSFFDDNMQFIIDMYQEGLTRVRTPLAENKMRGNILRKICQKKAPKRVSLLDQIDKITSDIKKEKISFPEGISILENIARKYGDPHLVRGIEQKANDLRREGREAATHIVKLLGQNIEVRTRQPLIYIDNQQKRKPLINFTKPRELQPLIDLSSSHTKNVAHFVAPSKKQKQHPMALFLQQKDLNIKRPKQRKRATRQPLMNIFYSGENRPLFPPTKTIKKRGRK